VGPLRALEHDRVSCSAPISNLGPEHATRMPRRPQLGRGHRDGPPPLRDGPVLPVPALTARRRSTARRSTAAQRRPTRRRPPGDGSSAPGVAQRSSSPISCRCVRATCCPHGRRGIAKRTAVSRRAGHRRTGPGAWFRSTRTVSAGGVQPAERGQNKGTYAPPSAFRRLHLCCRCVAPSPLAAASVTTRRRSRGPWLDRAPIHRDRLRT
jgi:hypothetical protein